MWRKFGSEICVKLISMVMPGLVRRLVCWLMRAEDELFTVIRPGNDAGFKETWDWVLVVECWPAAVRGLLLRCTLSISCISYSWLLYWYGCTSVVGSVTIVTWFAWLALRFLDCVLSLAIMYYVQNQLLLNQDKYFVHRKMVNVVYYNRTTWAKKVFPPVYSIWRLAGYAVLYTYDEFQMKWCSLCYVLLFVVITKYV